MERQPSLLERARESALELRVFLRTKGLSSYCTVEMRLNYRHLRANFQALATWLAMSAKRKICKRWPTKQLSTSIRSIFFVKTLEFILRAHSKTCQSSNGTMLST